MPRITGIVFAFLSLALFGLYFSFAVVVSDSGPLRYSLDWIPQLGLSFSFYLDGLSVLFGLIISGIGFFIFVYSQEYLAKSAKRVFWIIFMFLLSMLGVVSSDNLILLFIFWELTSITSYMLIGMNHEEDESRFAALQALIVTGGAGLALLAGILLIYTATGTLEISELLRSNPNLAASPLYVAILILVLLGAFAKSAQFPLHFWLPGAMAAPTPVSAFLHSATMVKAGIFLMARLHPVLGGTPQWNATLLIFGGITMVSGAVLALPQRDLKKLLAYTTVSALGIMTFLMGIGTDQALQAMLIYIVIHALYKAALFLIIGAVDHEAGSRLIDCLGGLRKSMPITFGAAIFAVLSMSGIPPFIGFIGKELMYEAQLHAPTLPWVLISVGFITNALTATAGIMAGVLPFVGKFRSQSDHTHEAPFALWIGPVVLGALALVFGIMPGVIDGLVIEPAFGALRRGASSGHPLALWHGYSPVLLISIATLVLGMILVPARHAIFRKLGFLAKLSTVGPAQMYKKGMAGFLRYADAQTVYFQNGSLHRYAIIIISLLIVVLAAAFTSFAAVEWPSVKPMRCVDVAVVVLIVIPSLAAIVTESRLASVLELSAVGLGVTLLWVLYGAPDLALTQLLVEALTFVLLMLMVGKLPKYRQAARYKSCKKDRALDFVVSFAAGTALCVLVLQSLALQVHPPISDFFAKNAAVRAHGRNVVNVILVDFRGLDTLGEITVIGLAAIGVMALLGMKKLKNEGGKS